MTLSREQENDEKTTGADDRIQFQIDFHSVDRECQ